MLAFYRPLQRDGYKVGYRDHQTVRRLYLLPEGLTVVRDSRERAAFSLLGYAGESTEGWRFTLGLSVKVDTDHWETDSEGHKTGVSASPIPMQQVRMRLKMVVPLDDGTGDHYTDWSVADTVGHQIGTVALELDKNQGLILKDLLNAENLPVDALTTEIEIEYKGLRSMFPVRFAFAPRQFEERMKVEIKNVLDVPEDTDFRVHEQALSEDTARAMIRQWLQSQEPESFSPPRSQPDTALTEELELRLLEAGWQPADVRRVTLRPLEAWTELAALADKPQKLRSAFVEWDLRLPKVGRTYWKGQWSVSEFLNTLDDAEKSELFPMVPVPEPLKPVPIHITNTIPLGAHQIRKVILKLHYFGTSLDWEDHEVVFDRSDQIFSTHWAILPWQEPFFFYYGFQAFWEIPEGGGWPPPPIHQDILRSEIPYLGLKPSTLGLVFLKLEAQIDAFENIGWIEIRIFRHDESSTESELPQISLEQTSRLTAADRERFALIRKVSDTRRRVYQVVVHPPEATAAEPITTVDGTNLPVQRLLITAYHTQVLQPEIVYFRLKRSEHFPVTSILVRVRAVKEPAESEGELLMLDPTEPEARWTYWRSSIFEEPAYFWRAEIYFTEGTETGPATIEWQESRSPEQVFSSIGEIR